VQSLKPCIICTRGLYQFSFNFILILSFHTVFFFYINHAKFFNPIFFACMGYPRLQLMLKMRGEEFKLGKTSLRLFYSYANNFHRNYYTKCVRLARWIMILMYNRKSALVSIGDPSRPQRYKWPFLYSSFFCALPVKRHNVTITKSVIFLLIEVLWHKAPKEFVSLLIEYDDMFFAFCHRGTGERRKVPKMLWTGNVVNAPNLESKCHVCLNRVEWLKHDFCG
jgi:hypothetical protein